MNKSLRNSFAFLSLFAVFYSIPVYSANNTIGRNRHYGIYGSFFTGDPFPLPVGFNFAVQPLPFLRFHSGIGGTLFSSFGWSAGGRILLPFWQLSPMVGVSYGEADTQNTKLESGSGLTSSRTVRHYVYGIAGFDFLSDKGFNIGFGATWEIRRFTPDSPEKGPHPFLNVGYFFN